MNNQLINHLKPVAIATVIFLILSVAYMLPALEGKTIQQSDVIQHLGMSKELVDYRNETGREALWTNSMFGGMPGYLVSTIYKANKLKTMHRILVLGNWRPVCFVFLYLLGFYLTLLAFGVNPWLSIVGAIAYAFSSYFLIIIEVGHISKVLALGYLPAIIGGIHLAFKGKYLWGSLMTGIALGLQIYVVHLQITYYTMIIAIIFGIVEFIYAIREKFLSQYFKALLFLFVAALLAVGSNMSSLWTTYEYGKYSIRGPSELTYANEENKTSGLDLDYATDWSYGKAESFTLLIPRFMGGSSMEALNENTETFKYLSSIQGKSQARKTIKQIPAYWGDVTFTSGPVYVGAIICFLFVFALFVADKKYRWWLLVGTIVSLILAWGRNVPAITEFVFKYLPGYNKFRAVSMTLVIVEFTMPLLAVLGLNKIMAETLDRTKTLNALKYSFYIVGGLLLIIMLGAKGLFQFEGLSDEQYRAQGMEEFVDALQADRLTMLRRDAFRSLVFISLAAGVLFFYLKEKLKMLHAVIALGVLILVDLWAVDKRYLNSDDFVTERKFEENLTESPADQYILRDNDRDYRVLNLAVSPFQDATTSYFHKSLGGYHGAKMRRYQEIWERQVTPEMQTIISGLQAQSLQQINNALMGAGVMNMLNTRYIIYNPEAQPLVNNFALGNAWFVKDYNMVENADEEIQKVGMINPAFEAVVDIRYSEEINKYSLGYDSVGSISLEEYKPNYLKYHSISSTNQLAVFSEIYYPEGWTAKIDGAETEHFRADYILRAMVVPSGEHTIEFEFKPGSYYTGEKISLASSLVFILFLLGGIAFEIRKQVQDKKQ